MDIFESMRKWKNVRVTYDGDKLYTGDELGFSLGNCEWVGKAKYTDAVQVTMSCGGGWGGSMWYYGLLDTTLDEIADAISDNTKLVKKTIRGTTVCINPRYIVQAKPCTLIERSFVTQHPNARGVMLHYYILTPQDHKVTFLNEYQSIDRFSYEKWE